MKSKAFTLVAFAASVASAAVKPAALFNHDMVLQSGRKVPVWGMAAPGERVKVAFAGQELFADAGTDGRWRVDLSPLAASEVSQTLTIGENVFTNVVVGEVWLCSGQSNMSFAMWPNPAVAPAAGRERNGYYDALLTDEPSIRGVTIPNEIAAEPIPLARQTWHRFTPGNFDGNRKFSAIGFHYALRMRQALKVPIGIVVSAWGGSRIEPWVPACGFKAVESVSALAGVPIATELTPEQAKSLAEMRKKGTWRTEKTILYDQPRSIYNAMIHPLEPFQFRGVVWYQGESNRSNWREYYDLLKALHRGWMERFENPDMAFYLTQITSYGYYGGVNDPGECRIREEMERFGDEEPNAGCASVGDVGDDSNIHPSDKRTVATRLAALALNRTYGMKQVKCDAPKFRRAVMQPYGRLVLHFDHVEGWCKNGNEAEPFELAGDDGVFVPVKSEFRGTTVVLTVPKGMTPRKVAYMRQFRTYGRLRNEAGLPVLPFVKDLGGAPVTRLKYHNSKAKPYLKVGLWAWPMPMDWDRDGLADLVVSCPCVPSEGVYFFRNLGATPGGDPVFDKPVKVSSVGYDNLVLSLTSGREAVTTSKGIAWDFRADCRFSAYPKIVPEVPLAEGRVRGNVRRFVDFDGDGRDDILIGADTWRPYGWDNAYDEEGVWTNGHIRTALLWCRNLGGAAETAKYAPAKEIRLADGGEFATYGNPMPMVEDWDGDGDLDILCGSFLDGFTYYANVGTRTAPAYAHGVKVMDGNGKPVRMDLEMITPSAFDWNGDGKADIICGDEDGRVALIANTGRLADGVPVFGQPVYFRQKSDDLGFGALSTPFAVDWDGDGDEDLIVGNSAGYLAFIENRSGKGVAEPSWAEPKMLSAAGKTIRIQAGENGSIQGPAEAKWGYTVPTVADWDGDGYPDVMINSIFGDIVWYRNPGRRGTTDLEAARPVEVEWQGAQPALKWGWRKPHGKALLTQWRTTPAMIDLNRDGLMDLVMLDTEGYLAFFERFSENGALKLRQPRRVFGDENGKPLRLSEGKAGQSGRRKFCFLDWNGDGRLDLVLNGANAEVMLNAGESDGRIRFEPPFTAGDRLLAGHTTCPTACDFDGDGKKDILLGAEDGRFYLIRRN